MRSGDSNDWEEVKRKGDESIRKWTDDQMHGKTGVVVLVGAETVNRPGVIHGISTGWNGKRGVLGIRIDKLLDTDSRHNVQAGTQQRILDFDITIHPVQ